MNKTGLKQFSAFLILIGLGLAACDIIDPPHYGCTDPNATNYDPASTHPDGPCLGDCEYDTTAILGCTDQAALNYNPLATSNNCDCIYEGQRNVLVEDYTGHTCGNCPRAAEILHDLEVTYGVRIVPLAVHIGFFANTENNPDGSYSTDFKTPEGAAWDAAFGCENAGLPTGLLNRTQNGNAYPQPYTTWAAQVANLLDVEPDALLDMTNTYDSLTRTVTTDIDINILNDLNAGGYSISVVLSEDSVIDWQKDYDPDLPDENLEDYVHMHVMRTSFNGTWGDAVGSGGLSAGTTASTSYSLQIDTAWDAAHCNVVSFIYQDDNKEVIQAEYRPVME